jgi:alpha-beta hydrolase superfamily lysophospholipase
MRLPTPAGPTEMGVLDGLAYSLWLPSSPPAGGLVVLHGAGSCKENHHDMARAARDAGLAAVCFDMRGHGASGGALDGRAVADVVTIASLVPRPVALRGSSMGGWLAIAASEDVGAAAVVALCPASESLLALGLRSGQLSFPADRESLEPLLYAHALRDVVGRSTIPLLLLHAEGDERVPYRDSVALHAASVAPVKKLIVVPGGHHRSVQHDAELQGVALQFVKRAFAAAAA